MRAATGEIPVISETRDGTHCGAEVNMRLKRAPSEAKRSMFGVRIVVLP